jgi:hypothetical protein
VLALVGRGGFHPRDAVLGPDLAGLLFMEAVHQAEEAALNFGRADKEFDRMVAGPSDQWLGPCTLAASELDRALRVGLASIVLSIASR